MRKIGIFTMMIILVISLLFIGCKEEAPAVEEVKPKEEIHWMFYNAVPYAESWYRQILDQYMAEHPGQDYEMSSVMWDEFFGKFSAAAAGEAEIDILFLDSSIVYDLADMNGILDLTDKIGDTSIFRLDHPGMVSKINDRIMALPLNGMDLAGIFYNKDIFEKYGLETPKTYDELVLVSKTLRENGVGPLATVGTPLYLSQPWQHYVTQLIENPMEWALNIRKGTAKFTEPEVVETFRWFKKMIDDGVWVDNLAGIDENTAYAQFVNGDVAMHYNGTWIIPALVDTAGGEEMLPSIGVMPFPYLTPENRDTAVGGFYLAIAIYSGIKEEKLQGAIDILKYMTSAESCKILTELDGSPFASRNDVIPEMGYLTKEFLPIAESEVSGPFLIIQQEVREALNSSYHGVVAGMITPEEAAQTVQDALDMVTK